MCNRIVYFVLCFNLLISNAQEIKEGKQGEKEYIQEVKDLSFSYKQLIIPGVLIGYGAIRIGKYYDVKIQTELKEHSYNKIKIDDFAQYTPALSVYALNFFGVEGRNNLKDRTVILATSLITVGVTVEALKHFIDEERPDGSKNNSFPSGHTAMAFAGAEFLYQEYRDVSIWYGIAGYAVATGTGILRIYNDRHWFKDVAAGAGIGILSTKIAYWLHPFLNKKLFNRKESDGHTMLIPFYNGKETGVSFSMFF